MTKDEKAERLLFGDDFDHLFIALLGDRYSVREQRLALLAALVAKRLVL